MRQTPYTQVWWHVMKDHCSVSIYIIYIFWFLISKYPDFFNHILGTIIRHDLWRVANKMQFSLQLYLFVLWTAYIYTLENKGRRAVNGVMVQVHIYILVSTSTVHIIMPRFLLVVQFSSVRFATIYHYRLVSSLPNGRLDRMLQLTSFSLEVYISFSFDICTYH